MIIAIALYLASGSDAAERQAMSEQRAGIVRQFCAILEKEGWNPDDSAIEKIVDTSFKNKEGLLKMLSQHPKWDNNVLRITMPIEPSEERLDVPQKMEDFRLLLHEGIETSPLDVFESVLTRGGVLTSDDCFALQSKGYHGGKHGQKIGRAINAWATAHGIDKHKDYHWRFNELINGGRNTIDRTAFLSINPVDFLTASHGDFNSCHCINQQKNSCYKSGNLSYAMDGVTMVFFTVASGKSADYPAKRIDRINYHFDSGLLIQGRLYTGTQDDIHAVSRAMMCKVIADCLDTANLWTKHAKIDKSRITSIGNHYADYSENPAACVMSTLEGITIPDAINIGHVAYCISCGSVQEDSKVLDCCDSGMLTCENCNTRVHEDDAIFVGDYYYCSDCVSCCDHCEEYHHDSEVRWVDSVNQSLCDDCFSEHYAECIVCAKVMKNSDAFNACSDDYCEECFYERFSDCEECGGTFGKDELTETDEERWVCKECYRKLKELKPCKAITV